MIISIKEVKKFIISIFIPLALGFSSSFLAGTISGGDISTYYSQLIKPSFAPPSAVFGIVWTILYIIMGISAYKIMSKGYERPKVRDAMFYYWLQLILNFIWSILFFGFDLKFTALIDLILIIIFVIIMIVRFAKIDKKAAYMNIPYLIWLFYALVLNYIIWIINK